MEIDPDDDDDDGGVPPSLILAIQPNGTNLCNITVIYVNIE